MVTVEVNGRLEEYKWAILSITSIRFVINVAICPEFNNAAFFAQQAQHRQ
jgi:hypothetical protein